jgi:hypothetical protein
LTTIAGATYLRRRNFRRPEENRYKGNNVVAVSDNALKNLDKIKAPAEKKEATGEPVRFRTSSERSGVARARTRKVELHQNRSAWLMEPAFVKI